MNYLIAKAQKILENRERTKVQALSLAKECVINKLDLLTNATVVEDAMKFVENSKEELMSKEEVNVDNESKQPDYDQELKQKEEKESGELATTTTATIN